MARENNTENEMTLQAKLNKQYFDLIGLDSLLDRAIDNFSRNQIKCKALQLADHYDVENQTQQILSEIKRQAVNKYWIK